MPYYADDGTYHDDDGTLLPDPKRQNTAMSTAQTEQANAGNQQYYAPVAKPNVPRPQGFDLMSAEGRAAAEEWAKYDKQHADLESRWGLRPDTAGSAVTPDYSAFKDPYREENRKALMDRVAQFDARQNLTADAATIDGARQGQARSRMMRAVGDLETAAAGGGPSLATQQMQSNTDQAIKAQLALAASARGINPALAASMAARNAGEITARASQDSAALRTQEQMSARQQLMGALTNVRGQDIGLATDQARLQQDTSLANLSAGVGQQNARDQMIQSYLGGAQGLDRDQWRANMDKAKFKYDVEQADQDRVAAAIAAERQQTASTIKWGVGTAAKAASMGVGGAMDYEARQEDRQDRRRQMMGQG